MASDHLLGDGLNPNKKGYLLMNHFTLGMRAGRGHGLRLLLSLLLAVQAVAAVAATPLSYIGYNSKNLIQPTALATTPDGRTVYAGISGMVLSYAVTPGVGTLTQSAQSKIGDYTGPTTLVMDVQGKFLYAGYTGGIMVFGIGADGALGGGTPYANGVNYQNTITVSGLVADPSGNYLYALTQDVNNNPVVYSYLINRSTGALTQQQVKFPVGNATSSQGGAIALSPDGKYAFVVLPKKSSGNNFNGGGLFVYSLASGSLDKLVASAALSLYSPGSIALSNDGKFIYVASWAGTLPMGKASELTNAIAGFSFRQGSLTPLPGFPMPTALTMTALTVGARDSLLYAAGYRYNGQALSMPGSAGVYGINPASGVLSAVGSMATTNSGDPSAILVSPDGKYVYVSNEGPGYVAGGLIAYSSPLPLLGVPQVDVAAAQTTFAATLGLKDSALISGAGFYYSTTPALSPSTPSVPASVQGGSISASINNLAANTTYYVFPYVTLASGVTYAGASQAFSYGMPLTATPASAIDYSDVVVSVALGNLPQAPVSTGFVLGGEIAGGQPVVVAGTLTGGIVKATLPRALVAQYGSYSLTPFATLSGAAPTGSPRLPLPAGGVTYLGATTTLQNTPYFSVTAKVRYTDVKPADAMVATLEATIGDVAFNGAGAAGFCYDTNPQPVLPACKRFDWIPQHSLTYTATKLLPKTTYYIRAFVRYPSGAAAYSNAVQLYTAPAAACLTPTKSRIALDAANVVAVNDKSNIAYVVDKQQNINFLSGNTGKIVATVKTAALHLATAYDSTRGVLYYATGINGGLYAVDGVTGKSLLSNSIPSKGANPLMVVNPATGYLYVGDSKDTNVYRFEPTKLGAAGRAKILYPPSRLVMNTVKDKLYVIYPSSNGDAKFITVLAADLVGWSEISMAGISAISFSAAADQLYAVVGKENLIIDGDSNAVTTRVAIGMGGEQVRYAAGSKVIYNSIPSSSSLWTVLMAQSPPVSASINLKGAANDMALHEPAGMLYAVTNNMFLTAIDTDKNSISAQTLLFDVIPDSIGVNQVNGQIFVGSTKGNAAYVVTCQ